MLKLICQLCNETVALFDLADIKLPLRGSMFKSPDPAHDVPAPFFPEAEFEFMRCPYGGHRPMILPTKILTDKGILNIPSDGSTPAFGDPENERTFILDRDQLTAPVPMMSDEEAEKLAREQIATKVQVNELGVVPRGTQAHVEGDKIIIVKEVNIIDKRSMFGGMAEDGKTETESGKQADGQPVKKEETIKTDSGNITYRCADCNKGFLNISGYINHMRMKHKIKLTVEEANGRNKLNPTTTVI